MIALGLLYGLCAAVVIATGVGALVWRRRLGELAQARETGDADGAESADGADGAATTLSVIVPARNEAHNLPHLLASLAAIRPPLHQVIVVDDHSTDGTGELARAAGATVVTPGPLPEGWVGKSWACHAGAAHATGQWLLFTDADTVHAPWSAATALAAAQRRAADLLSLVPTHAVVRLWERLQGAFHVLLLLACRAGSPGARTEPGERRFSIGQYLLFRAEVYRAIGGHAHVRDRLAEDLALARAVVEAKGRFELLHAPGLMTVRMYPEGLTAFVRGWRRSFRDGLRSAGQGGAAELFAVIGWLLGLPLAAAALVLGELGVGPALPPSVGEFALLGCVAGYLLTAGAVSRASAELGPFPRWAALVYPLPVLAFVAISALAALDHLRGAPVAWRGRQILQIAAPPSPRQPSQASQASQPSQASLPVVSRWQLLYSPGAWRRWIAAKSATMKTEHNERNFASVAGDIAPGASVLDIGAWDGRLGELLAARRGCQVTLVDVVDKNETALPLRRYDGRTLPCAEGERFEVVQLLYVLHHAQDDARLLAEARRVVAAGGRVLVAEDQVETLGQRAITVGFHVWLFLVTWMPQRGRFRTRAQWRERFFAAGFDVERERDLGSEGGRALWPRNVLFVLRPR